jgi:hypothetical protein
VLASVRHRGALHSYFEITRGADVSTAKYHRGVCTMTGSGGSIIGTFGKFKGRPRSCSAEIADGEDQTLLLAAILAIFRLLEEQQATASG